MEIGSCVRQPRPAVGRRRTHPDSRSRDHDRSANSGHGYRAQQPRCAQPDRNGNSAYRSLKVRTARQFQKVRKSRRNAECATPRASGTGEPRLAVPPRPGQPANECFADRGAELCPVALLSPTTKALLGSRRKSSARTFAVRNDFIAAVWAVLAVGVDSRPHNHQRQ